jgi:hypothetical protein
MDNQQVARVTVRAHNYNWYVSIYIYPAGRARVPNWCRTEKPAQRAAVHREPTASAAAIITVACTPAEHGPQKMQMVLFEVNSAAKATSNDGQDPRGRCAALGDEAKQVPRRTTNGNASRRRTEAARLAISEMFRQRTTEAQAGARALAGLVLITVRQQSGSGNKMVDAATHADNLSCNSQKQNQNERDATLHGSLWRRQRIKVCCAKRCVLT